MRKFTSNSASAFSRRLKTSENGRFLVCDDGNPFYWFGDTAWELLHRLNHEDARRYLKKRADQGFTVIQAVVLAEFEGIRKPNAYGDLPLIDENPATPNDAYFVRVDWIVEQAKTLGLAIGMLPTWGIRWGRRTDMVPAFLLRRTRGSTGSFLASATVTPT
jgi:hypothetical protein